MFKKKHTHIYVAEYNFHSDYVQTIQMDSSMISSNRRPDRGGLIFTTQVPEKVVLH